MKFYISTKCYSYELTFHIGLFEMVAITKKGAWISTGHLKFLLSKAATTCASYAYTASFTLYKIFLENNLKFVV